MEPPLIKSEIDLAAAALALGAPTVGELSDPERALIAQGDALGAPQVKALRKAVADGGDPLGEAFTRLRSPEQRRPLGATYTPGPIIESMVAWAAGQLTPDRVVDPGAGSARFSIAAGRQFPNAEIVAVEIDPLAALCARANLAVAGMADRASVVLDDFRTLPAADTRTLWIGNPPYVRHHQLGPDWKAWLTRTAKAHGHAASQLAGLHVHFFLATAHVGQPGDVGCYITAAEWLDVGYGKLVRELLLNGLGGLAVHVLDATAAPFADAATTGAISCFKLGSKATSLKLRRVEKVADLGQLDGGRQVKRERLAEAPRWSVLMRSSKPVPEGFVELGELCRVHRGAVTGANNVWVTSADDTRVPAGVLAPSVTKARELFAAGERIVSADQLRRVINLPEDLDVFDSDTRKDVDRFLAWAKKQGADQGYIARHRAKGAWWSIGMKPPAPILATYMARKPPAFVRNDADARHINIAHGLYPRVELSDDQLDALAESLRGSVTLAGGRTYAGGLVKFEPREMERLPVPTPEVLAKT
jgi:hypothetical protein